MASSASLLRRVAIVERKLTPPRAPRSWSLCLEEGQELAADLVAQLGKWDEVIIRYYPANYMGDCVGSQVLSCWIDAGGGKRVPHIVRSYGVDVGNV